MVERTAVNPWPWSLTFGFNPGELVEGATRTLYCAGQRSIDENGVPQHPDVVRLNFPELLIEIEATAVA
jgi:hypothetical protein